MEFDLSGKWRIELEDGRVKEDGFLPGTLDENKLGDPDRVAKAWHPDVEERNKKLDKDAESDKRIATRLTRNYTYEGKAKFSRVFRGELSATKRYFLYAERARAMSLKIDGHTVPVCESYIRGEYSKFCGLSAPYLFEVTKYLKDGSLIEITTDNTYPDMPYRDITFSSAATDETQTNWNGVVGKICIEEKEEAFISSFMIFPEADGKGTISGEVELSYENLTQSAEKADEHGQFHRNVRLVIEGECLQKPIIFPSSHDDLIGAGNGEKISDIYTGCNNGYHFGAIDIAPEFLDHRWDEGEGNLLSLSAKLYSEDELLDEKEVTFGFRSFGYDKEGRLTLNDRRIFLRCETNCALFPETGHPPMDKDGWFEIMKTYASYGVNCVRFHSWCPPKASFETADELGILVQPELPNWNPRDAFGSSEAKDFYENELRQIIKTYGNHPSFVMLSMGNELHTDEDGIKEMHRLMDIARAMDHTKLYAWGSNNFYGEKGADSESDFYTSSNNGDDVLRLAVAGNQGRNNTETPNSKRDFSDAMKRLRKSYKKPFFSFEVGQYEVLPDLNELELFKGVTRPDNLQIVKDRMKAAGLSEEEYDKRVSASGELALLSYREEVEAVLRTPEMSGISLLGLQDFTGQGTALVGMLSSHLKPKSYPFAKSSRFKAFLRPQSVLVLLDKYTYNVGETLRAEVKIANYGKEELIGNFNYEVSADLSANRLGLINSSLYMLGTKENDFTCPVGSLTSLGFIDIHFGNIDRPMQYNLIVRLANIGGNGKAIMSTNIMASYPIWVYPNVEPKCPESVYETDRLDEKAFEILDRGGKVYYSPKVSKETMPNSIKTQFTTDFWSVGTFPFQEGAMGQLIDVEHPILKSFPSREYTSYQWFQMASQRAFILPRYMKTIVAEMDSYVSLRPMAQLFEARCGKGKVMVSSMGLQDLQEFPEARALLHSIYEYMESDEFLPDEEITREELEKIIN